MRTADTLAKRHDGQWVIVHSPEVPIHEQREALRTLLGQPTHPDFALMQYRDSDGDGRTLKFSKPETAPVPDPVIPPASVPTEPQNVTQTKTSKKK
jgi:hypothetical protein